MFIGHGVGIFAWGGTVWYPLFFYLDSHSIILHARRVFYFSQMCCLYILHSKLHRKTYVGITGNLERRIKQHNWGTSAYIKKYGPWVIIYKEYYKTMTEARKREKYLKSAVGRRWMKKYLFDVNSPASPDSRV